MYGWPEHLAGVQAHLAKRLQQALTRGLDSSLVGGNPGAPARAARGTVAAEHRPFRPVHLPVQQRLRHAHFSWK
jgi:hypothetical protein